MSCCHILSIYGKLNNLLLSKVGCILYTKAGQSAEKLGEHLKNN